MLKKINVLGNTIDIIHTSDNNIIQNIMEVKNDTQYAGIIDYQNRKIYINTEQTKHKDTYNETLLHECIHAISNIMQLDLTEEQVEGLGAGLVTMIEDIRKL